ncbi:MAG: hypothetical protein JXR76_17625 [Deltaproteobacteria bacterium]|nr:hypothetical protein [Deltaproteobacteria bacterium]
MTPFASTADTTVVAVSAATSSDYSVETFNESNAQRTMRPILKIAHRLDDGPWRVKNAAYPVNGQAIRLGVHNPKVTEIRWYLVFADITRIYKNANPPGEPNAYQWTGLDPIAYHRIEIDDVRGKREINPMAHLQALTAHIARWASENGAPSWAADFYHSQTGTFWFQVEGKINGKPVRSLGLDDITERGISVGAFRMSVRQSDDFAGWITSFYNVPGVFGSIIYQSNHYLGADCADVMMTAWSRWKRRPLTKNFNVQMLLSKFPTLVATVISDGTPDQLVQWRTQVKEGDLIAVRYGDTGKKFHHVGALLNDANGNGVLDADDQIIHAGPYPLHVTTLAEGAFDGHVVILRP